MDQPGLDPAEHARALAGLRRINRLSGVVGSLWRRLAPLARVAAPQPLRVLDVASGGGDVAIGLAKRARRGGLPFEIVGVDFSQTAVDDATRRAVAEPSVRFERRDALADALPAGFHAAVCTLFVHHLDEPQVRALLERMAAAAPTVLVSDLRRSTAGWLLAQAACRVLSRSPIVHYDGPVSVEGAFTPTELRRVAAEAGLAAARVETAWPQRMLLHWRRADASTLERAG